MCSSDLAYRDNVVHYNWHWFRRWGTAETGNNAPHFADVARWALGGKFPKRVVAAGGLLFPRKDDDYCWPDTYNLSFEYPGDKLITFELTSHVNGMPYHNIGTGAMIYGENGSVYFGPLDDVTVYDGRGKVVKEWKPDASSKFGSLTNPTHNLDLLHMMKFAECVRAKDQSTFAPADEGYMSSYIPLIGNIALETGEALKINPETGRPESSAALALWAREYEKGWELV